MGVGLFIALVQRGVSRQVPFPETGKPDRRANMVQWAQESMQARGVEETQGERHVEHTGLSVLGAWASPAQGP